MRHVNACEQAEGTQRLLHQNVQCTYERLHLRSHNDGYVQAEWQMSKHLKRLDLAIAAASRGCEARIWTFWLSRTMKMQIPEVLTSATSHNKLLYMCTTWDTRDCKDHLTHKETWHHGRRWLHQVWPGLWVRYLITRQLWHHGKRNRLHNMNHWKQLFGSRDTVLLRLCL